MSKGWLVFPAFSQPHSSDLGGRHRDRPRVTLRLRYLLNPCLFIIGYVLQFLSALIFWMQVEPGRDGGGSHLEVELQVSTEVGTTSLRCNFH